MLTLCSQVHFVQLTEPLQLFYDIVFFQCFSFYYFSVWHNSPLSFFSLCPFHSPSSSFPYLWLLSTMQKYGSFASMYYHIVCKHLILVGQLSDNLAAFWHCLLSSFIHQFSQTIPPPSFHVIFISQSYFEFIGFLSFLHSSILSYYNYHK